MESDRLEQIKQARDLRTENVRDSIKDLDDIFWLIEEVERLRGIVGYIPLEEGD